MKGAILAILTGCLVATAAYSSGPQLRLETARSIVAKAGVNVGTVFMDAEGNRFRISNVRSSSPTINTFVVVVKVSPL